MPFAGEIAALACAFSWSISAIFFTSASHRVGSFTMSHYRMLFGCTILVVLLLALNGRLWPADISTRDVWLLVSSGIAGFFLCDLCLFQSYVDIGPRVGSLFFNTYPFIGAFIAWHFLGEHLSRFALLGMAVTLIGIVWVVMERAGGTHTLSKHLKRGIMLALCASLFQAIGLVLSKPAMHSGGVDPLTATFIRAIAGGVAYWITSVFRGRIGHVLHKSKDHRAMSQIAFGAIFGPSFGVWLMMIAVKYAPIGIASTIMALMPVTILPLTAIFYKEKITYRMVIGAIVACLGVAILFNT